jgi:hypothetical protein
MDDPLRSEHRIPESACQDWAGSLPSKGAALMTTTSNAPTSRSRLFSFPDPVNDVSARLVASGVVLMALAIIAFDQRWLTVVLAYGFVARVLTGPTLSPLGQVVTRVITPRLGLAPKYIPGPPKRFAQGIGVVFSVTAVVLTFGFDTFWAAKVVLGLLLIAASLEAFAGICLGCKAFAVLMRLGVIPEEVCERCNDLWAPRPDPTSSNSRRTVDRSVYG